MRLIQTIKEVGGDRIDFALVSRDSDSNFAADQPTIASSTRTLDEFPTPRNLSVPFACLSGRQARGQCHKTLCP